MHEACGYMDSAAWYVKNGYKKVDDYMQLTFYASTYGGTNKKPWKF